MEIIKNKASAIGLALAISVGMAACGSSGDQEKPSAHKRPPLQSSPNIPKVQVRYFPDGSRELVLNSLYNTTVTGTDPDVGGAEADLSNIYEWCDGRDFMEETMGTDGDDGGQGSNLQRIVNYVACADGRLTPSDFAPSSSER